ncbi:MAG: glycosyltransferase [Flavobacteriales bacterium]|nr:glycosyltransferase [Flavobacteriales bacterium]
MKILRIINRFNLGGPTYNAAHLTRYLSPKYETKLIGGAPLPEEEHSGFILDNLGLQYSELKEMKRGVNALSDVWAWREMSRIIKEYRPDIVHTHAAKAGALGRMAAWRNKVPIIVHTFHGHVFSQYFNSVKTGLIKKTERFLASKSDAIVAISESQKRELVHVHRICSENKVRVIPLGLDLLRFSVAREKRREIFRKKYLLEGNEFALGIIGRFAAVKNHNLFFDALKLLASTHPQKKFKAFVIGDGTTKREMIKYCAPLRVSEKPDADAQIIFTSWIKNMEEVLPGLDCVVLTSLNEGTPVSLIEAQAASVPVISTDVGGVQDCMIHNQTGILLHSFDEAELTDSILNLHDPALRFQMGQKGCEFVNSKFSWQRLVADMDQLYTELALRKMKATIR